MVLFYTKLTRSPSYNVLYAQPFQCPYLSHSTSLKQEVDSLHKLLFPQNVLMHINEKLMNTTMR